MSDAQIIKQFLEKIKQQLERKIQVVTGRTVGSLEVTIKPGGGQLLAAPHIGAIEYGRGPRVGTEDHGMWEEIQKWLSAKGKSAEVSDAVGLTLHINKHGTNLFQSGTPSGVISEVINEKAFNSLARKIADARAVSYTSEVLKKFKPMAKII